MTTSDEAFIRRAEEACRPCGPCDAGLPMGCNCDPEPRAVIAGLLDVIERSRARVAAHPTSDEDTLAEWRERIGVRLMNAMKCYHEDAYFGDGAVCDTCFDNTQRIGALIEAEAEGVRAAERARVLGEVTVEWGIEWDHYDGFADVTGPYETREIAERNEAESAYDGRIVSRLVGAWIAEVSP
jgi:hypothetical protein